MRRLAMNSLIKWKKSSSRKPLIIQGARQVGKTWLMKEFGKEHFSKTAYFVFEKNQQLQDIFKDNLDANRILEALSLLIGYKITPDTLIIFDEIQECPSAITSLKYFYEQCPEYSIIAAGSLLGVSLHKGLSFPVGKVDFLTLYPLNFYEFLDAIGEELKIEIIQKGDFSLLRPFHNDLMMTVKKYMFVGGMPEVVYDYAKNKDYQRVREKQQNILRAYQDDFSKHIPPNELAKIRLLWEGIPSQLSKENKKFIYGALKKGSRAKDFENGIAWLEACGLIHKVHSVTKPDFPLNAYLNFSAFKLFVSDIGLLSAMSHLDARILLDKTDIFEEFKGALAEQYVLQELLSSSNDLLINYWTKSDSSNELDFIIQYQNNIIPIEVKSGVNLQSKSLNFFIKKYNIRKAIRFSASDYHEGEVITDMPLYAVQNFMYAIKE